MKNKTALMALSCIMSFRMLGLFMILPVFSVAAMQLPGATPKLIGFTLGIYGLTQACLQIPFGMLSDRIGRKPVIFFGLILFFIGSIICALSHSIYLLLCGRALQGAGAIGSTVLATVADITPENARAKAMAFIGLSIGCSFMIAMIAGPIINHYFQLSGIFWATALLSLTGIALLKVLPILQKPLKTSEKKFKDVLKNKQLLKLNVGIFSLHAILTALFIVIPIILTRQLQLSSQTQIVLYLAVLIVSFALALPFIILAEAKKKMRTVFFSAIATLFIATCLLLLPLKSNLTLALILTLFFTAFTLLEALLPSLVSKTAPPEKKGAAMGVYSSSQFFGIFVGGTLGGAVFAHHGISGVFALCAIIAGLWFLLALEKHGIAEAFKS